ncbi:MAG: thioredoxin domain-containing protein [Pseudomonadota bacterium]
MAIQNFTNANNRLSRLFKTCIPLALTAVALLTSPAAMTEEAVDSATNPDVKMDAILLELKAIRQVLEKIEKQGGRTAKRPSKPTVATMNIEGRPTMGSADAPVTVVEFADYQCPFCLRFSKTTFPHLKKNYIDTGKVRWVALNLPLAFHKDARKAAQGALCAGDQGKFWEMRETLFENPKAIGVQHLPGYAQELSLDVEAFNACLNSDRHLDAIDKDAQDARGVKLTGTPSFIIGKSDSKKITGKVVIGAQPVNVFNSAIKQALEQQPSDNKPSQRP